MKSESGLSLATASEPFTITFTTLSTPMPNQLAPCEEELLSSVNLQTAVALKLFFLAHLHYAVVALFAGEGDQRWSPTQPCALNNGQR